jgi:hypothetical protein
MQYSAKAMQNVSRTSGINIRVNKYKPTDVASAIPASIPAIVPNAQAANSYVSQHRIIAPNEMGMRAAQSCTPKARKHPAINQ